MLRAKWKRLLQSRRNRIRRLQRRTSTSYRFEALEDRLLLTTFNETSAGLTGVARGTVDWGDYDSDGDLDILLVGEERGGIPMSTIYRNDGSDAFTDIGASLTGVGTDASAAWGDYDNDGDLDVLLMGATYGGGRVSEIYRNDGNDTFTNINASLTSVSYSSAAWGDYDNDGDLDILLTGLAPGYDHVSKIYRNDGSDTFTDIGASLMGTASASVAWGDYDDDGDLDILLVGADWRNDWYSKVYRNDGGDTFTDIAAPLTGVAIPSVAWGDYDNDGDLDILLTGSEKSSGGITKIYRNDGSDTFTDIGASLPDVDYPSVAWGDYDNDGDLDILLTGRDSGVKISKVYRNDGSDTFTDSGASMTGVYQSAAAWGDYDNDGDLDILLTGRDSSNVNDNWIAKLYRNDTVATNTAPTTPGGLNVAAGSSDDKKVLSWNSATDAETPAAGLTYNVRVGTSPGASDVLSPMSDTSGGSSDGRRRLAKMGAQQQVTNWTISGLDSGTYYWSVQAVDTTFAGSPWASEGSFVVTSFTQAPTDIGPNSFAVDENTDTTGGVSLGTLTTSDPDTGDTFTYTIQSGGDAALFAVGGAGGDELILDDGLLDFETKSSYSVTVRVTDAALNTYDEMLTVNVTNIDEFDVGPITDMDAAANRVGENAANGTAVGITALATDADATDAVTYSLDDNAGGRFAIHATTGVVTVANGSLLDYEAATSHNIILRGTSTDASFNTQTMTIDLTNIDEFDVGPISDMDAAANQVSENAANGTAVGITALATDADATDTVTYSLDDDAGGRFAVHATSGVVTVADGSLLDYEAMTSHNIILRATSTDASFNTQTMTVAVTNIDESDVGPITDMDAAANQVSENAANGTAVGITAVATDADATDAVTYNLDDNAGGRFAIHATTGVVTVADGSLLDYEAATSHNIILRATSTDTSFNTQLLTIDVNDLNESPTDIGPNSFFVDENANTSGGLSLGALTTSDPDAGDTFNYTILPGGDAALFTVGGIGGDELILDAGLLDFETTASYSVTVRVNDAGFNTYDEILTVNVNDLNEAPTGFGPNSFSVDENTNSTGGLSLGTLTTNDPDTGDTFTYTIQPAGDGALFTIGGDGDELILDDGLLDFETKSSYSVTVRVTDGGLNTYDEMLTVNVNDLNEAPTDIVPDSFSVDEGTDTTGGKSLGTLVTSDPDTNDTFTYTILPGGDGALVSIGGVDGDELILDDGILDFETKSSYLFVVRVIDSGLNTYDEFMTVSVNDLSEFPPHTIVVDTTSDVNDGDTSSIANLIADKGADGRISLREAILATNNTANGSGPDTIGFDMRADDAGYLIDANHGHSWWRIQPTSELPTITDSVIIDGYSQDGAMVNTSVDGINAVLRIELNGSLAGKATGLATTAGGNTIRGLAINSFMGNVWAETGYIGGGIELREGDDNHIAGNFIGTDVSGTIAPNGPPPEVDGIGHPYGIEILADSGNNWVGTNGDGENDLAERNLISGYNWGVVLRGSSENVIAGNLIGTDRTGTESLGNWAGVGLLSHYDTPSDSNRIGTNADGKSDEIERNVISGNRSGIGVGAGGNDHAATNTLIAGNLIGPDVNGDALGNSYVGMWVAIGASSTQIGGPTAAYSNTIAFNGNEQDSRTGGIVISDIRSHVDGNRVQGNSIHSNIGLGIDLTRQHADGVTENDPGDTDSGPNNFQNFPELISALTTCNSTTITGTINSTPDSEFTIELFSNAEVDDRDDRVAEGERFLDRFTVTTDSAGTYSFSRTVTTAVPEGQFITATATDLAGNTSEFSRHQIVALDAPPVADAGGPYEISEGDSLSLDASGTVYAGAESVSFSWDLNADDDFSDATGATPTLTWEQLTALGIDDGPDNFRIAVIADLGHGGVDEASAIVRVNNVAPVITDLSVDSTVINEDGSVTVSGSFTDPGTQDTHTVLIDWGTGEETTAAVVTQAAGGGTFTATHQYKDDNPTATAADAYTITATVTDDDGGSASDSTTLMVSNVAPVITDLSLDSTVINEDGSVTVSGSFSDAGTHDTHTVLIDWGTGESSAAAVVTQHAGRGTFTATHQYTNDILTETGTAVYTVTATVADDDGASASNSKTVTVNQVVPSLNPLVLSATTINEDGSIAVFGTLSVGWSHTETVEVDIDWGDGSAVSTLSFEDGIRFKVGREGELYFSATHRYLDDNPTATSADTYTITAELAHNDVVVDDASATVLVNNVDPGVEPLSVNATTINENESITVQGMFADPGTLDTHRVVVDWGDGTVEEIAAQQNDGLILDQESYSTPQSGAFSFRGGKQFAQTFTVGESGILSRIELAISHDANWSSHDLIIDILPVIDGLPAEEGSPLASVVVASGTVPKHIEYYNSEIPLTLVDLGDDNISVQEGDELAIVARTSGKYLWARQNDDPYSEGASFSRRSYSEWDKIWDGGVDFGFRTFVQTDGDVAPNTTGTFDGTHAYAHDGTYTITTTVIDDDGGRTSESTTITVDNADPVITDLSLDSTVINEDGSVTVSGSFTDAGTPDTHTVLIDWGTGEGSTEAIVTQGAGGGTFTAAHQYKDDNPTATAADDFTITATVIDDDGGSDSDSTTLTVNNVAPTLSNVAITPEIDEGEFVTLTGNITDPGVKDTFELVVDWGEGAPETFSFAAGTTTFSVMHQYLDDNPTGTPSDGYEVIVSLSDDDGGITSVSGGSDSRESGPIDVLWVGPRDQSWNHGSYNSTQVTVSQFATQSLTEFDVIYVDASATRHVRGGLSTLQSRAADVAAFVSSGGGLITETGGHLHAPNFSWVPNGASLGWVSQLEESTSLTVLGANHPVTAGLTNSGLSNWLFSQHNYFSETAEMDVLATNPSGQGIILTGDFGSGRLGIFGTDPSHHQGTGQAIQFIQQAINWVGMPARPDLFVTVNNVDPEMVSTALSSSSINPGQSVTLSSSFTDPGMLDTHQVSIDWGDGTVEQPDIAFLDQQIDPSSLSYAAGGELRSIGRLAQTLTVGEDGILSRVELPIAQDPSSSGDLIIEIRRAADGVPTSEVIASVTIPSETVPAIAETGSTIPFISVDLSSFDIAVSTGDQLAVSARTLWSGHYTWAGQADDPYAQGDSFKQSLFTGFRPYDEPGGPSRDFGFRTFVQTNGDDAPTNIAAFDGTHSYTAGGTYTVTVTVNDDDGGVDTKQFEVTVKTSTPFIWPTNPRVWLLDPANDSSDVAPRTNDVSVIGPTDSFAYNADMVNNTARSLSRLTAPSVERGNSRSTIERILGDLPTDRNSTVKQLAESSPEVKQIIESGIDSEQTTAEIANELTSQFPGLQQQDAAEVVERVVDELAREGQAAESNSNAGESATGDNAQSPPSDSSSETPQSAPPSDQTSGNRSLSAGEVVVGRETFQRLIDSVMDSLQQGVPIDSTVERATEEMINSAAVEQATDHLMRSLSDDGSIENSEHDGITAAAVSAVVLPLARPQDQRRPASRNESSWVFNREAACRV